MLLLMWYADMVGRTHGMTWECRAIDNQCLLGAINRKIKINLITPQHCHHYYALMGLSFKNSATGGQPVASKEYGATSI